MKLGRLFVWTLGATYSQTPAKIVHDLPVFVQTVAWLHGGALYPFSWAAFSLIFNQITGHLNPREVSLQKHGSPAVFWVM